jgi:hypothetical protein
VLDFHIIIMHGTASGVHTHTNAHHTSHAFPHAADHRTAGATASHSPPPTGARPSCCDGGQRASANALSTLIWACSAMMECSWLAYTVRPASERVMLHCHVFSVFRTFTTRRS